MALLVLLFLSYCIWQVKKLEKPFLTVKLDELFVQQASLTLLPPSGERRISPLLLCVLQVFVGLSFPYEGPAPLEALANGCIFLNPRLNPPRSRLNSDFFKDKPNIREVRNGDLQKCFKALNMDAFPWLILELLSLQVTSQHPYAEAIGEPYVWMVDMDNSTDVERAVRSIINQTVSRFLVSSTVSGFHGSVQRVSLSDGALHPLRVHLWGDAPESQRPDWEAGWMSADGQGQLRPLSSQRSFSFFLSGLLFRHSDLASSENAPGGQSRRHLFL